MSKFLKALRFWKKTEKAAKEEKKRESMRPSSERPQQEESDDDAHLLDTTDEEQEAANEASTSTAQEREAEEQSVEDEKEGASPAATPAAASSAPREPEKGLEFSPEDGLDGDNPFRFLSPWFPTEYVMEGNFWSSIEHYLQSKKSTDRDFREKIRTAETVQQAVALGEEALESDHANAAFEEEAQQALREVFKAYFTQVKEMSSLVIGTNGLLVFTSQDPFWGVGPDGDGQNIYGKTLMEVREELRMKKLKAAMTTGTPLSM